nr:protein RCC2 homolog [Tanacetum cinerariifolium]
MEHLAGTESLSLCEELENQLKDASNRLSATSRQLQHDQILMYGPKNPITKVPRSQVHLHLIRYKVVRAGSEGHTVVQTEDGCSFSFGWNKHGQLGTGSIKNEVELSPVQYLIPDNWYETLRESLRQSGEAMSARRSERQPKGRRRFIRTTMLLPLCHVYLFILYVIPCLYIRSLSVMLSRIPFHVLRQ